MDLSWHSGRQPFHAPLSVGDSPGTVVSIQGDLYLVAAHQGEIQQGQQNAQLMQLHVHMDVSRGISTTFSPTPNRNV